MEPEVAFVGARRSLEEAPSKGMEGLLSPAPFPGGHCRGPSVPGSSYAPLDGPSPPSDAGVPSAKPATSASPLPYGCFGGGYCSYRVAARGSLKPCPAAPPQPGYPPALPEKYVDAPGAGAPEEYQPRPAELAFYPGYAGHYQPVAGYLDVSVVQSLGGPPGSARHEALLPVDPYHEPWALAGGWSGQGCCPKDPGPPGGHFWKAAFAEAVGQHPPEGCSFRRGRKKRIPYSKGQLKELEKEYSNSKFITKDKRRKISAATNLSERQITIWFQNRRVKEKKVVAKIKTNSSSSSSSTP